jgi:predicted phage baseplate assembly protein
MSCSCGSCGSCGCCTGIELVTPVAIDNRPGLDAIVRRVGTHALFFESMLARLATVDVEAEPPDPRAGRTLRPLRALTTRATDDPAIALLDAWALVADVLTFYQERIANEGYLRTATERRSVMELARLIGYRLRPGVAASVYLAFTVEKDAALVIPRGTRAQSVPAPGETMESFETGDPLDARAAWNVLCPRRTAPDFPEFSKPIDDLYLRGAATGLTNGDLLLLDFGDARFRLHTVAALEVEAESTCSTVGASPQRTHVTVGPFPSRRIDRPAIIIRPGESIRAVAGAMFDAVRAQLASVSPTSIAKPITKGLNESERLVHEAPSDSAATLAMERFVAGLDDERLSLIEKGVDDQRVSVRATVAARFAALVLASRSVLVRRTRRGGDDGGDDGPMPPADRSDLAALLDNALVATPKRPPRSGARLDRKPDALFGAGTSAAPALLTALNTRLGDHLYQAWGKATSPADARVPQDVFAFRVKAAPFGHNAAWPTHFDQKSGMTLLNPTDWALAEPEWDTRAKTVRLTLLALDAVYDQILPGSRVVIVGERFSPLVRTVEAVDTISRPSYGMAGRVTQLTLDREWIVLNTDDERGLFLTPLRTVRVYAQSEALPLAERPVDNELSGQEIELDGLFQELDTGRWIIVTGERIDLPGVEGREVAMIAGVSHVTRTVRPWGQETTITLPGERVHTRLTLADPLTFVYRRDSVKIWGNVAKATHGETRVEVLGAGDATVALQTFALKNHPLTYLSAPTPEGAASTLEVRVNDVRWHEASTLASLSPDERAYITDTDDSGTTNVIFGDGEHGSRVPTGAENVRAVYRSGIGQPGNVRAEQISLLATRPLGLKEVVNPLRATGGAEPDSRDQARRNAPLVTRALGRLVSVEDYADFARTFAGIGKASSVSLTDGRQRVVHLTVAGADDAPLDETSDLIRNLREALRDFGEPSQPFVVAIRELRVLVIAARIRIDPDYLWEKVESAVRATMLDAFGFDRRELGQDVTSSEVIAAMAHVTGVTAVDLDVLAGFSERDVRAKLETLDDDLVPASRVRARLARVRRDPTTHETTLEPAELAMLTPAVPDTLILNQWMP